MGQKTELWSLRAAVEGDTRSASEKKAEVKELKKLFDQGSTALLTYRLNDAILSDGITQGEKILVAYNLWREKGPEAMEKFILSGVDPSEGRFHQRGVACPVPSEKNPIAMRTSIAVVGCGDDLRAFSTAQDGSIVESQYDGHWTGGRTLEDVICKGKILTAVSAAALDLNTVSVFYIVDRVLQEQRFDGSSGWHTGEINKMEVDVAPYSSVAATFTSNYNKSAVRLYIQVPDDTIQEYICSSTGWNKGTSFGKALLGTDIAVVANKSTGTNIRVFYQDSDLDVVEMVTDNGNDWFKGPLRIATPITRIALGATSWIAQSASFHVRLYYSALGDPNRIKEKSLESNKWVDGAFNAPSIPGSRVAGIAMGGFIRVFLQNGTGTTDISEWRSRSAWDCKDRSGWEIANNITGAAIAPYETSSQLVENIKPDNNNVIKFVKPIINQEKNMEVTKCVKPISRPESNDVIKCVTPIVVTRDEPAIAVRRSNSGWDLYFSTKDGDIVESVYQDQCWKGGNVPDNVIAKGRSYTPMSVCSDWQSDICSIYFVGVDNVLQERIKAEDDLWVSQRTCLENIVVAAYSSVAIISKGKFKRRLFVQLRDNTIQEFIYDEVWSRGCSLGKGYPGTDICVISTKEDFLALRVYFQDDNMTVVERCLDDQNSWINGSLKIANKVPRISLGALCWCNSSFHIRLYYGSGSNQIREMCHEGHNWYAGDFTQNCISGSRIAALATGTYDFKLYFQVNNEELGPCEFSNTSTGWKMTQRVIGTSKIQRLKW